MTERASSDARWIEGESIRPRLRPTGAANRDPARDANQRTVYSVQTDNNRKHPD